ncbi:MAG: PD40 domain-containing protein, partial [Anaerolineales bacterium]|nr:PD40 domain-containing protein [Anaerolineales bacterium]
MRFRRQTGPRWPRVALLIGLTVAVAALAGFALLRPELVSVAPASGAVDVSPHTRLRFAFSQPMAEAAITSEPENLGELSWNAEFTELTIKPRETWPREQTVTFRLNGGRSRLGLPLLGEQTWTFTVGAERLIYLEGASNNLYLISLAENAEPRALTAEPLGVNEYTLHPNGESIVYSARREDGGADLHVVEIETGATQNFLLCPGTACRAPVFSPDGRRVAYERQLPTPTVDGSADFGNARVFVFTPETEADEPVGEIGNQTRTPRWAPDGRLSFYDAARQAIVVRN